MNIVNPSNPFQIPSCLQRADSQQRRRERFKKGFIAAVVAVVILLVGLLIEGCMSEQTTTPPPRPKRPHKSTGVPASWTTPALTVEQKPSQFRNRISTQPAGPPRPFQRRMQRPPASPRLVYVVKSGDSLTRIAKAHGTTVKALKAANGLENDRIVVGAKLKIPTA